MKASADHMTLGELVETLRAMPEGWPVYIDGPFEPVPGELHSYRGHYSDLAVTPDHGGLAPTVAEFIAKLEAANGRVFEGFKGGDFTMTAETPVWVSERGHASGLYITGVRDDRRAVITVKEEQ